MSAPLSVENRKSRFSLRWLLLHGGVQGRRANGSVKMELLAELCEGQGGQRGGEGGRVGGGSLCRVGSTRRMGEKGGTTKDADRVVRMGSQKMREQMMKWLA